MHQRSRLLGALTAVAGILVAGMLLAQTPPAAQTKPSGQSRAGQPAAGQVADDETAVFRADTNLIVLHASAIDKNGKLLTNLPQSAFKVFENGMEQPLKLFRREDVPVSMGLVIDNSGSMRDKRSRVAAASMAMVKASNPDDEQFIVNFNDDAFLDQSFTNNLQKLEQALDRLDSRGGTAMRDAISMSIDYLKEKGKKDKKVLLVVTDGNDNTSNMSLEQLVRKAQQSEVLIYCIGLLNEEEAREAKKAKRALHALAQASGGLDYYPKDLTEVGKVTPEVAHEIRNQYVLAYSPTNATLDGTFRKINVTVAGPGRPTVRTRSGYYATPATSSQSGSATK